MCQLGSAPVDQWLPGSAAAGSVVAEGADQLGLRHRGAALDAEFAGALDQVVLGPVVVGRALAALGPDLLARAGCGRVRDPGGFFLAVPLAPQRAVRLLVLDLGPGHAC